MLYSAQTGGFYVKDIHGADIPTDAVEISDAHYAELLNAQVNGNLILANVNGYPIATDAPAPTQDQIVRKYEIALDKHLDAVAQANRYDNRFTFAMRAGYPGPWQSEGIAFGTWMDTCNEHAFTLLQNVLAGTAELPTIEDFIASLPTYDARRTYR